MNNCPLCNKSLIKTSVGSYYCDTMPSLKDYPINHFIYRYNESQNSEYYKAYIEINNFMYKIVIMENTKIFVERDDFWFEKIYQIDCKMSLSSLESKIKSILVLL